VTSAPRQRPRHHWSKIFSLRHYANCASTTLTVLILHNVESVYFVYGNPVYLQQGQTADVICLSFVRSGEPCGWKFGWVAVKTLMSELRDYRITQWRQQVRNVAAFLAGGRLCGAGRRVKWREVVVLLALNFSVTRSAALGEVDKTKRRTKHVVVGVLQWFPTGVPWYPGVARTLPRGTARCRNNK
jgi:hypothetical protein